MSLWEPFTERARRSVVLAQEECQRLGHNYVGTEHLLLGLLKEGGGVANRVLTNLGANPQKIIDKIISVISDTSTIKSNKQWFNLKMIQTNLLHLIKTTTENLNATDELKEANKKLQEASYWLSKAMEMENKEHE